MAESRRNKNPEHTNNRQVYNEQYVYGNTVRQPEELPKHNTHSEKEAQKQADSQVQKNRSRALDMNPQYVIFLICAAICAVLVCVSYMRMQFEVVSRSENITSLQRELADLTEQNDTAYHAVFDSVNLEEIRDKAVNDLGMVFASKGCVIEYNSPTGEYVKQHSDIPSDGVLAKSKSVTD